MTQGNQPNPYQQNPDRPESGQQGQPHDNGQPQQWFVQSQPGYGERGTVQSPQSYGSPQQTYGQQDYSQQGYGQQGGYGIPQQAHPQQPTYPQQGAYPTPQQAYPQQGYGQHGGYATPQQAYGQGHSPYTAVAQPRSPLLGMIAFGVVAIATVLFGWSLWRMGMVVGPMLASSSGAMNSSEMTEQVLDQLGTPALAAMNIGFYGGVAGWITGIVATATRRGRSYGVWTIILGVLAPVIGLILMIAPMMPYMS